MPIGDYWECVLPPGTDSPPLERIVGESTILFRREFSSWKFRANGDDAGGAELACMTFASGDLRAIVHVVKPRDRGRFYLHSAFPWAASGVPGIPDGSSGSRPWTLRDRHLLVWAAIGLRSRAEGGRYGLRHTLAARLLI